jgi:hypothetical protein
MADRPTYHLHLWLLTGRRDDFSTPLFNSWLKFWFPEETTETGHARDVLRLRKADAEDDFYVLGALAAAMAVLPALRKFPAPSVPLFPPHLLQLPRGYASVPMLPPDGQRWPSLSGERAGIENWRTLTITKSGNVARLSRDGVLAEAAWFSYVNGALSVPAAAAYGVDARFSVPSWADGDKVVISLAPGPYPYENFAERMEQDPRILALLQITGNAGAFAASDSAVERVGLVAASVMSAVAREVAARAEGAAWLLTQEGAQDE